MADPINILPMDEEPLTSNEKNMMEAITKSQQTSFHRFIHELRQPLIYAVLFVLLNLSQTNNLIQGIVPYAQRSDEALLITKTVIFISVILFSKNYHYIMK